MRALLALLLVLCLPTAWAHKPSDSYLTIEVKAATIDGRWDIALRDLDFALTLDADGNGELTWGEVRARHADIAVYAREHLRVTADDKPCTIDVGPQQIDEHTDGMYSVLPLALQCEAPSQGTQGTQGTPSRLALQCEAPSQGTQGTQGTPSRLALHYTLFADLDPQHRGLLNLIARGASRSAVLGPQQATQSFELGEVNRWRQFADYVREGVWHIWIGIDHILFLLSLLLPSVLAWQAATKKWQAVDRFGEAFVDVLKVVTAFTLAHSITLSLAALGVIDLPTRLVESVIAASIIVAALNNVWPRIIDRLWMVAFGFGLIHGFGFATVLTDLGLPRDALVIALVGFNVGVELGQLGIVIVFLPLAYALRRSVFYRRWVMVGGSVLITLLAAVWLVERAFGLKLLPF